MKASLRSLSKPVHALPSRTNSIKHAFPSFLQLDASPHAQRFIHTQAGWQPICLCWYPPAPTLKPNTDIQIQPVPHPQTEAPSRPTYSAVFSVPARTAFTFAVLASAVLVAARVTRPLVTPGAHPAVVTATGA